MTIAQMAARLGVSSMTIYRRLRRNGLDIADMRDDSGALTADGVATIGALFDNSGAITGDADGITDDATKAEQVTKHDTEQSNMIELARLQEQNEGLRALLMQVQSERDSLREQLATAQAALAAEIADRASERRLLAAGAGGDGDGGQDRRRRWRWPWSR